MKLKLYYLILLFPIIGVAQQDVFPQIQYEKNNLTTPTVFGENIISTKENSEFDLTFSKDGKRIYFTRREPEQKQKIFFSDFKNGNWSKPKIADFSTDRDETPFITPNGKYFFFGSEREIPGKPNKGNFDMNIWMMENQNGIWSNPTPIDSPINEVQQENEEWPSSNNNFIFSLDNKNFIYTTMERGSKSINLYETQLVDGAFLNSKKYEGIFPDDKYWIYSAVISPNGKFLIFNSYDAPGGEGGEDIYVSKKIDNGWSKPVGIGEIVNSKHEESSPRFSRDGKYFFFSRADNLGNYEYGEWNIMVLETKYLNLDKLF